MGLPLYLAMTASEISGSSVLPERTAWMACHFSAYSAGLSNCPASLPGGAMLILNDSMPVQDHDPALVAAQLCQAVEQTGAEAVLLDFQRPGSNAAATAVRALLDALPCPVAVTESYADALACPVFLSPPPLRKTLEAYLAPWQGREIWLEAAYGAEIVTVTPEGSQCAACPLPEEEALWHEDAALHCRYRMELGSDTAHFTVFRDTACLDAMLEHAQALGVTCAVGLYQELYSYC